MFALWKAQQYQFLIDQYEQCLGTETVPREVTDVISMFSDVHDYDDYDDYDDILLF